MKTIKSILVFATLLIAMQVNAQTDKETTIKIINNQNYVFNATSALPMSSYEISKVLSRMPGGGGGGVIQLTGSQYQLVVTKDSVESYLPYYGRAYTAPIGVNPDESGIKFKSKNFKYKADKKKKGSWVITMNFKDTKDVQSMTLNVSENGYATLNVNSNNKQSISFNGYMSEPKVKDKKNKD